MQGLIKKYFTFCVLLFFTIYQSNGCIESIVYAEWNEPTQVQKNSSVLQKTEKKKQWLLNQWVQKTGRYKHNSQSKIEIPGDGKKVKKFLANIKKDTEFSTPSGKEFFPSDISIQEGSERFVGGYGFEFGIPGTHLVFSKPIQMEMDVSAPEWSLYEILVKHEGNEKYNMQGLSVKDGGSCDTQGNHSLPGNYTKVKNGKVIFYTCGASRYIMNPTGGGSGTNDVRWIIGDYWQVQVYYNGLAQVYWGDPPTSGGGAPSVWPILRVGTTNVGNTQTAWTTYNTSSSQVGNTYTTTNTLTYTTGSLTYTLVLDWEYIAPDKFLTWSYNLTIPTGNTDAVKLYYGQDSYVAGADANDVWYYTTSPTQTVGIYDNTANVLSAQRYISGESWDGYIATGYWTVQSETMSGNNYSNTIGGAGDNGYGINWDLWTSPGTYTSTTEWRVLPYVSAPVPDVVPGIAQPNPGLHVGVTSQIPLGVTNAWNADSTGVHTMVLTLPVGIIGPASSFSSNGWSCGAQVGSTVTCTKTMNLASLASDNFTIPVTPDPVTENQTLNFSVSLSNASDSDTSNNTASVLMQVAVAPAPDDSTPPSIGNHFPTDNMILPIGDFSFFFDYSDEEGEINPASSDIILQKWNGSSWWADISSTYIGSSSITSTGSTFSATDIPYGKYKATMSISDIIGFTSSQEIIFYIDELEFTISTGSVDIGALPYSTNYFSSDELIVTIKTVGVPFEVTMNQDTNMIYDITEVIPNWNGSTGFGYEEEPYSGTINTIITDTFIGSWALFVNTNGDKNTYTYKIKFGANIEYEQSPWDYISSLSFNLTTSYGNPPGPCIFDESYFGCNL